MKECSTVPPLIMELFTTTGYSRKNYGAWLNTCMEAAPCEWVLIHDHDIFFLHENWFQMICDNIQRADNPGLLSCVTNRIGNPHQKVTGINNDSDDLLYHYKIAKQCESLESPVLATRPISGLMMITSKTAWKAAGGFRPTAQPIGLDNNYHRRILDAGFKAYLMPNVYVYHKYRKWGQQLGTIPRKEACMEAENRELEEPAVDEGGNVIETFDDDEFEGEPTEPKEEAGMSSPVRKMEKKMQEKAGNDKLVDKLNKALKCNKFLISITRVDKSKGEQDLRHYYCKRNFPDDDTISCMEHIIEMIKQNDPGVRPKQIKLAGNKVELEAGQWE